MELGLKTLLSFRGMGGVEGLFRPIGAGLFLGLLIVFCLSFIFMRR